ncbi:MAG: fibronectin type III domain-containing protein [Lachnospiraceae bacterium]|nr:fibronectin type III domain-containing protein [Lachnospiraceae bacterium]
MEKCSVFLELSKLYTTPCPSAASKSHKCQQKPPQRQAPTGHKHQQVTCASRNPRSAKRRQQTTQSPAPCSTCYKASFANNKNIGKATVTINGDGEVTGTRTVTFRILPGKGTVKSLKAGKKSFTATASTVKGGVKYQFQYRLGSGKWKSKISSATRVTVKKLKSGKTYQVKVRAFKKVSGKTYNGAWSKVKKVKVK